MKYKEAKEIIESEFGDLQKEDKSQFDTLVSLLIKYGADSNSARSTCYAENGGQVQDVGVLNPVNKPEDMPKIISVRTEDFVRLMSIAGILCDKKPPEDVKKNFNKEIRKIAVRHHINFVGEIKE